ALIARLTSDPDANNNTSGSPFASLMTYAPFSTPLDAFSSVFGSVGKPWRVKTSTVGFVLDSSAKRHAAWVSLPSAGRMTDKLGIALREGNCSIGSCVGPSSPTAIESWVNTYVTGVCIKADR